MSALINITTMTSREVAELTGKRHDNVLRDINNLISTLSSELSLGFKSSTYRDSTGKENRQYVMDRDSTYCLVTGYDANARMRIIKRWQELEVKTQTFGNIPAMANHTRRSIQVGHSKDINQVMMERGGRDAIVSYNIKNCVVQSGRLPKEWKTLGKDAGLSSRQCASAKDVLRVKEPQVACGMSLADQMVVGGVSVEDGISIGKESQALFRRMLEVGFTPPELLL